MSGSGAGRTTGRSSTQALRRSAEFVVDELHGLRPEIAIVLGSGLGGLADAVDDRVIIPYRQVPEMPEPTVQGHGGEFVAGGLDGRAVILQRGRLHLYEGYAADDVSMAIRIFAELDVGTLIVTNAAGGINPLMRPPTLMLIADHINLMFRAPLMGPVWEGEERFPDMSTPYDASLRASAGRVALDAGIELHQGVYAGVLGPSYETPAEISMLQRMGADAVGMSTVPEVIVARARGMRVLGISSITNQAAGISPHPLTHEEVLEAGKVVASDLERVVRGVVREVAA